MSKAKDILIYISAAAIALAALLLFNKIDGSNDDNTNSVSDSSIGANITNKQKPTQDVLGFEDNVALPETIYGIVGKPIVIRFLNITEYNSLDGISVEVEANGKGKVFADRWEYVPKEQGDIEITFTVKDSEGTITNKSSHVLRIIDNRTKNISALIIGDSTIESGFETKAMLDLATADGSNLTLLGTRTTSYINDDNNRHEGYNSLKALSCVRNEIVSGTDVVNPFYNPETKQFDFSYYMQTQGYTSVDVVCLQLGINDIFSASTDEQLYSDSYMHRYFWHMDKIIESIHSYDPNIKIVWNLISPGTADTEKFKLAYGEGQTVEQYKKNTYLTNLEIISRNSNKTNVYVAPTNAPLDTVNNMYEGVSGAILPSEKGCQEMGITLYSFIMAIAE